MRLRSVFALVIVLTSIEALAVKPVTPEVVPTNKEKEKEPVGTLQQGVYFLEPKDGAVLPRKFKVKMGVHGMRVKPAGDLELGTGHHHLIIDQAEVVKAKGFKEMDVIPRDEKHIHFGQGEEEVEIELTPGRHSLTLQFADGAHRSLGPKWSKTIHVTVK